MVIVELILQSQVDTAKCWGVHAKSQVEIDFRKKALVMMEVVVEPPLYCRMK
jgi:hypothetical protein